MKVYRNLSLTILMYLVSILSISCGESEHIYYKPQKFIQEEYSEARVIEDILFKGSEVGLLEKMRIDFKKLIAFNKIWFHDIKYKLSGNALDISCQSNDPRIQFANIGMRYNKVEIVLKSKVSGTLQFYWARVNENFRKECRKLIKIPQSNTFAKYSIDLSQEVNPGLHEYKFRIDPLDRKGELTIKSVTFYRVRHTVSSDTGKHVIKAGKVKINNEIREAFVMEPGREIEKEVKIFKGDIFSFGLIKFKINDVDCFFEIYLEEEGKEKEILFEKKLPANGKNVWSDFKLDLSEYSGKACKIILAVQPIDNEKTGLVFCSNPMLLKRSKNTEKPNVILISIDTLGARHLSLYGGKRNTDPFLKGWAREGVVFKNAFANSSLTHISHGTMLTGMAPLKLNVRDHWGKGLLEKLTTLSEILRSNNYITAAFTGGILVSENQGFDKGFELFYQENTLYKNKTTDIEVILRKTSKWIKDKHGSPFFLFIHSYEPHGRYYYHENLLKSETPRSIVTMGHKVFNLKNMRGKDKLAHSEISKYVMLGKNRDSQKDPRTTLDDVKYIEEIHESEIAFTDYYLKQFFTDLRSKGLLENTIVVFTADHGEAFFEHNLLEHGLLYDENLRVPLIFWGPGLIPSNISLEEYVSSKDIVPTIRDLINIKTRKPFDGCSLKPLLSRRKKRIGGHKFYAFVPENGFSWYIDNRYKFILRAKIRQENFGKTELFDLKEDPFEKKNLFEGMGRLPQSLKLFVKSTIKSIPGIHISFGDFVNSFPPGTSDIFEMKLIDECKNAYGFNIERIENKSSSQESGKPETLVCKIRLNRKSEIVIFASGNRKKIRMSLKPVGSKDEFLFSIPADNLEKTKKQIKIPGTEKVILAWRIKSRQKVGRKRLSPEEERKLKSIGYIQ